MAEEDVEVVRRLLLAYSRGDFPTMLDLIHAEIRVHPRPEEPGWKTCTRDTTGSSPTQATG